MFTSCGSVCTENLILFDYVTESPNVNGEHHLTCSPRWTASPLRPRLSFRYTQPSAFDEFRPLWA
jgi:hypothetical protein